MSYLNTPRLTFSGQFQADPSTVNNDPTHYNNQTFEPSYQDPATPGHDNGWWNPEGTGNWRFVGCTITGVTYLDGTSTNDPAKDPIIGMSVMDTDTRTAGKIVDLDSQQQMVSQIWGLIVRIVGSDGITLMKGDYEMAPFTNIWGSRSVDLKYSSGASAVYQSVIKNINWNDALSNSRYLNELKKTSPEELSIAFTVDRYNATNTSPQFTLGRIAGSIGPSGGAEPKHFVLGRQLFPEPDSNTNYATAIVDENLRQLVLDFGNSLQCNTGGVVNEKRDLRIGINNGTPAQPSFVEIGEINYSAPDWYTHTAGICTFPLTDDQMALLRKFPLAIAVPHDIFSKQNTPAFSIVQAESAQYVRADQFVFRLDPQDVCSVQFYATDLGKALPGAVIQVQDASASFMGPTPPAVGTPLIPGFPDATAAAAGEKPTTVTTDANGKAVLTFTAPDPGNPRGYIDGQVYGLSYNLSTQEFSDCNQANFISMQIYSGAPATDAVLDWDNFIQPIMQQYANLYPLMSRGIFNLANQAVVNANAQILKLVFSKAPDDPNYMPATRDLSAYKKKAILDYLQNIIDTTPAE